MRTKQLMPTKQMTPTKSILALFGVGALLLTGTACAGDAGAPPPTPVAESASTAVQSPASAPSVSAEPTAAATQPIELPPAPAPGTDAAVAWEALMGPDGEYNASASYAAVISTFGEVEPYVTIREAEERHIAALIRQLERDGVTVPPNPYLGNLSAPADLQAAASAWAEGEIANVAMYDALLSQTTDANLIKVLTNLRRASLESHLPIFTAAAANGGTLATEQMAAVGG